VLSPKQLGAIAARKLPVAKKRKSQVNEEGEKNWQVLRNNDLE
jgi:hypothetical protein